MNCDKCHKPLGQVKFKIGNSNYHEDCLQRPQRSSLRQRFGALDEQISSDSISDPSSPDSTAQRLSDQTNPDHFDAQQNPFPTNLFSMQLDWSMTKLKDLAEIVGKSVLGLIGICYVIGLIVVNINLNKFGVYGLSLFRVNYIAAGFWTLFTIFLPSFVVSIAILVYRASSRKPRQERLRRAISAAFVTAGFFLFIFLKSISLSEFQGYWEWTGTLITGFITVFGFLIVASRLTSQRFDDPKRIVDRVVETLGVVAFFIFHIVVFGYSTYGTIASYLGGGRPQQVQLILDVDEEMINVLDNTGIHFVEIADKQEVDQARLSSKDLANESTDQVKHTKKRSRLTNIINLISLTEEDYIIQGGMTTVSIRREVVKSVIYSSPKQIVN